MALTNQKKCFASEAAAYIYYFNEICGKRQKIPNPDDLVLIRNHAIDSQREQKLEPKQLETRLMVLYFLSKLTRYVCNIYSNSKAKQYHLNNILLYQEKRSLFVDGMRFIVRPEETILTVIGGKEIGEPEKRLFTLYNR